MLKIQFNGKFFREVMITANKSETKGNSTLCQDEASVSQIIVIWKLVITFDQAEYQNQALVVHASVISSSFFREPKQ